MLRVRRGSQNDSGLYVGGVRRAGTRAYNIILRVCVSVDGRLRVCAWYTLKRVARANGLSGTRGVTNADRRSVGRERGYSNSGAASSTLTLRYSRVMLCSV